jgi:DNA-directed RNA polymerase specialized sigma24 family protein
VLRLEAVHSISVIVRVRQWMIARQILVDHARRKHAQKRGDGLERITLTNLEVATDEPDVDVPALDEALIALKAEDPRLEQVVTLRYFAGMGIEQLIGSSTD